MRDVRLLGIRLVLGSYLAVHGAQKLFGAFGGPGLDQAGAGFDRIGLSPGKPMAALINKSLGFGGVRFPRNVGSPALLGRSRADVRRWVCCLCAGAGAVAGFRVPEDAPRPRGSRPGRRPEDTVPGSAAVSTDEDLDIHGDPEAIWPRSLVALRLVLGSQALQATLDARRKRIASFQAQAGLVASTVFPPGKFRAANLSVEVPGLVRSRRAGEH